MPQIKNDPILLEKISEAEKYESKKDFFLASALYKQALALARDNEDSENIKLLKPKLRETSKKSLESFKEVGTEVTVPNKILNQVSKAIFDNVSNEEALVRIGYAPFLQPDIEKLKTEAKNTTPLMMTLTSFSTIDSNGDHISGGESAENTWLAQMYRLNLSLSSHLFLERIFGEMFQKGVNQATLYDYFTKKGLIEDEHLPFIKRGLEAYFKDDYITTLCILVPRLESIFLDIVGKLGIDVITLNRSQVKEISIQSRTLSKDMVLSQELIDIFGEDLLYQFAFIFFDSLGYNLRHEVAHGRVPAEECNKQNANLVIYFLIVLTTRVNQVTKK